MKFFILLLFSVLTVSGFTQNVIYGKITDEAGNEVPGVRVSLENSTYGVPSSNSGNYFLEFGSRDTAIIKYQMIGFATQIDTLLFQTSKIEHNVVLLEEAKALTTVEIYADKRDIAKEIMGKVIDNKKNIQRQFESYECLTYIKTSLEGEVRDDSFSITIGGKKNDTLARDSSGTVPVVPKKVKMNFIESYSITQFKVKDTYKETILAHHDYAEKSKSATTVSADFSSSGDLVPSQVVSSNPYIFFEKVQDGDFDLYQNLIELPKVTEKPLVSPLAINAFINYKFTLNSIFFEDGQKIYDILVEPRFKESPLFSGNLYIMDSLWIVKSMDISINSGAMYFFKEFRIVGDYAQIDGNWVQTRREFLYTIKDGADYVMANTRVNHSDYKFNQDFDRKTFNNVIMTYDVEAFNRDSVYWSSVRPIQLKPEELRYIFEQDSIEREHTSDAYVDSVNNEYNRITFWDVTLNGVGFRNRTKKQEIYISPLISQIQPFGIGGYRHRIGGSYEKEFQNAQAIRLEGDIDYGFRNKDVKGQLGVEYTYIPRHFGSFKINGGDIYDFVTTDQSVSNILSRGNYVRKTFIGISQRYELVNGLYARLSYDYSTRRDISGIEQAPWAIQVGEALNWQPPQPYDTYTVSIFELELLYRFKQSYILKGNKKLVVGTEYPELSVKYKRGVPGMFDSDVDFNFLELGASDKVNFGTFGDLKWNAIAGTFFGKTAADVQFIERKFFRGSDLFLFSPPLSTMQLLDSTFNTTQPYLQAFAIHHFNGAILGKIPLINKLKLQLVGGAAALFITEEDYSHIELYAGIERIIKIRRQLFKVGVFYVARSNGAPSANFNFKIGLDFFNSFTNSWSY